MVVPVRDSAPTESVGVVCAVVRVLEVGDSAGLRVGVEWRGCVMQVFRGLLMQIPKGRRRRRRRRRQVGRRRRSQCS
jgi:hypothetical protein